MLPNELPPDERVVVLIRTFDYQSLRLFEPGVNGRSDLLCDWAIICLSLLSQFSVSRNVEIYVNRATCRLLFDHSASDSDVFVNAA